MFDFKFYLDTGNASPVCCRQPVCDFHKSKVMTKKVADLKTSGRITGCEEVWGSLLLLAVKHHQENYDDLYFRIDH